NFSQLQASGLGNIGHRTGGTGVDFQHVDVAILDGELHVHQTFDVQRSRHEFRLALDFGNDLLRQGVRGQAAGRVARVDPRLLNVLHDAPDKHHLAVGDAIDIDLGGVVQEVVKQYRRIIADLDGLAHIAFEILLLVHDFHGTSAQYVAG